MPKFCAEIGLFSCHDRAVLHENLVMSKVGRRKPERDHYYWDDDDLYNPSQVPALAREVAQTSPIYVAAKLPRGVPSGDIRFHGHSVAIAAVELRWNVGNSPTPSFHWERSEELAPALLAPSKRQPTLFTQQGNMTGPPRR
jgi:hypothetical protein